MAGKTARILSLHEAAAIVYSTNAPADRQVNNVRKWIARGMLKSVVKGKSKVTTMEYVAEFMASQTYHQQTAQTRSNGPTEQGGRRRTEATDHRLRGGEQLNDTYHDALKEYMLAVLFRRRRQRSSRRFQRAVLLGQACVVVVIFSTCIFAVRPFLAGPPVEQQAVTNWLESQDRDFHVLQWFPATSHPDGDGKIVRVRYRYHTKKGKPIITDRSFQVVGTQAALFDSEE